MIIIRAKAAEAEIALRVVNGKSVEKLTPGERRMLARFAGWLNASIFQARATMHQPNGR